METCVAWVERKPGWVKGASPKGNVRAVATLQHELFEAEDELLDGVIWKPVRCPKCGGRNCPTYASHQQDNPGIRYHACECGQRFKSIEEDE